MPDERDDQPTDERQHEKRDGDDPEEHQRALAVGELFAAAAEQPLEIGKDFLFDDHGLAVIGCRLSAIGYRLSA